MTHHDENEPDDGVYAIPRPKGAPRIKVAALLDYCKKNNKKPMELTELELEPFLLHD